jgi:hypothetical protein
MSPARLCLLALLALTAGAHAADDRSPYDKNPACLDRTVDASTGDCVIKDDGTPRQKYPPRAVTGSTPKGAAPVAAPASGPREAAPPANRRGG